MGVDAALSGEKTIGIATWLKGERMVFTIWEAKLKSNTTYD
jgi:hypothetical protein